MIAIHLKIKFHFFFQLLWFYFENSVNISRNFIFPLPILFKSKPKPSISMIAIHFKIKFHFFFQLLWFYFENSVNISRNLIFSLLIIASGTSNLMKDKYSPLSCSIPSLSPSVNGCVNAMAELVPPHSDFSCLVASTDYVHDFLAGAQELIECFSSGLRVLNHERERLKLVMEATSETTSISSRTGAPGNIPFHLFYSLMHDI